MLLPSTFDEPISDSDIASESGDFDWLTHRKDLAPFAEVGAVADQIVSEIPFLRQAVRRWHRDAADADDLVQETLLRALASAHLWQPGTSMRAWLSTIMRNHFLTALARAGRSKEAAEGFHGDNHLGPAFPDVRLALRDLDRALGRLPKKQRLAVWLAGIEGKSYGEAAQAMGLTPDAVRCHLTRARSRLRSTLDRRDDLTWLRPAARTPSSI